MFCDNANLPLEFICIHTYYFDVCLTLVKQNTLKTLKRDTKNFLNVLHACLTDDNMNQIVGISSRTETDWKKQCFVGRLLDQIAFNRRQSKIRGSQWQTTRRRRCVLHNSSNVRYCGGAHLASCHLVPRAIYLTATRQRRACRPAVAAAGART